jgi:hypothetical protein
LPLRKARAATNSLGGMMLLSVSNVLITLDIGDGTERPYEFSARTMNIYDVAGFKSLICANERNEKEKSPFVSITNQAEGRTLEI